MELLNQYAWTYFCILRNWFCEFFFNYFLLIINLLLILKLIEISFGKKSRVHEEETRYVLRSDMPGDLENS